MHPTRKLKELHRKLYLKALWLIAPVEGEDHDLTCGAEAEGDESAEACGDEERLRAFGVPVVELFA